MRRCRKRSARHAFMLTFDILVAGLVNGLMAGGIYVLVAG